MILNEVKNTGKVKSILVIIILMCSGIISTIILNSSLPTAAACSAGATTAIFGPMFTIARARRATTIRCEKSSPTARPAPKCGFPQAAAPPLSGKDL